MPLLAHKRIVSMATIFEKVRQAKSTYPVDVDKLAQSLGISVVYVDMHKEVSGALVRKGDLYVITINKRHPRTRQRFTLAHELGHYIHHRPIIGDGVNDSKTYRTTDSDRHYNPRILPEHETEANQFAASLLMPMDIVERLRARGLNAEEIAKELQVSRHAASIRIGVPYNTGGPMSRPAILNEAKDLSEM